MNAQTGIVNIRGKEYHTVAKRVNDFRDAHPEHSLTTEIIARDNLVTMKAIIADPTGRVIATGHAEEDRSKGSINKTSALENAETSAIGRALAAFGIGGTEFASANEVENAIHQQQEGHSQGNAQGAVSPPAKPPAHSALKKKIREFVHEIHGVGDWETWLPWTKTDEFQKIVAECQEKLPGWWEGWPEQPDGFTPLRDLIENKHAEFQKEADMKAIGGKAMEKA